MSRWRDLARRLKEIEGTQDDRDNRDVSIPADHFVPNVPIVPRPLSLTRPTTMPDAVADWMTALAALDPGRAPIRHDPAHWSGFVVDARWLCERHGHAAHRLGWRESDLFGIGATPGSGGLADHLEGARKLMLTDRIAHWRGDDLEGWLWRETMRPMTLIWELKA